ncbi:MAG: patatin-like phospholipase family protein [Thioalkalivibrio sp.]|nr:MAG: patatin-like phospholipase family protein [Thioalkalivibrio sp.]
MNDHNWNRRRTLAVLLAGAVAPVVGSAAANGRPKEPRIGLALGSGGARGLAHVQVFEVLDALGLRPHRISGASIGAVMGALYAAGLSASDIHDAIDRITKSSDEGWLEALLSRELTRWLRFIEPGAAPGGVIHSDAFIDFLQETAGVSNFEELAMPLQVVATDFWSREMVVFDSGDLWAPVQASMAVPGLFKPVSYQDRLLVDGGLTNPVPFDLLEDCDLIIAVDVLGTRTPDAANELPSSLENIFNTFQIMQNSILSEKLRRLEPDIMVRPEIEGVRVLEFYRFEDIFEQGRPARDALEAELRERLGRPAA